MTHYKKPTTISVIIYYTYREHCTYINMFNLIYTFGDSKLTSKRIILFTFLGMCGLRV